MICIPSSLKAHFCNDTQPLFNRTQVVVLAICAICQRLHICIRKPNARRLWKRALATAGMQDCDGLVLFGGPFFYFISISGTFLSCLGPMPNFTTGLGHLSCGALSAAAYRKRVASAWIGYRPHLAA